MEQLIHLTEVKKKRKKELNQIQTQNRWNKNTCVGKVTHLHSISIQLWVTETKSLVICHGHSVIRKILLLPSFTFFLQLISRDFNQVFPFLHPGNCDDRNREWPDFTFFFYAICVTKKRILFDLRRRFPFPPNDEWSNREGKSYSEFAVSLFCIHSCIILNPFNPKVFLKKHWRVQRQTVNVPCSNH